MAVPMHCSQTPALLPVSTQAFRRRSLRDASAHTTANVDLGNGKMIEAAGIVSELNIAMKWLAYPGRINGTATSEAVDFATPGGMR